MLSLNTANPSYWGEGGEDLLLELNFLGAKMSFSPVTREDYGESRQLSG